MPGIIRSSRIRSGRGWVAASRSAAGPELAARTVYSRTSNSPSTVRFSGTSSTTSTVGTVMVLMAGLAASAPR